MTTAPQKQKNKDHVEREHGNMGRNRLKLRELTGRVETGTRVWWNWGWERKTLVGYSW